MRSGMKKVLGGLATTAVTVGALVASSGTAFASEPAPAALAGELGAQWFAHDPYTWGCGRGLEARSHRADAHGHDQYADHLDDRADRRADRCEN